MIVSSRRLYADITERFGGPVQHLQDLRLLLLMRPIFFSSLKVIHRVRFPGDLLLGMDFLPSEGALPSFCQNFIAVIHNPGGCLLSVEYCRLKTIEWWVPEGEFLDDGFTGWMVASILGIPLRLPLLSLQGYLTRWWTSYCICNPTEDPVCVRQWKLPQATKEVKVECDCMLA